MNVSLQVDRFGGFFYPVIGKAIAELEKMKKGMEETRSRIIIENGKHRYFDKNGTELKEGDTIEYADGRRDKLYLTTENQLGTDATNPAWIESGRTIVFLNTRRRIELR